MIVSSNFIIYKFCLFIVGNVINVETGKWAGKMSGLGAGLDSFYEYLLKVTVTHSHIIIEAVTYWLLRTSSKFSVRIRSSSKFSVRLCN